MKNNHVKPQIIDVSRLSRYGAGKFLWRGLDDFAHVKSSIDAEKNDFDFQLDRREFLKLAAASMALTSAGCSPPPEKIVPYVSSPEQQVPGMPKFFATTMTLNGYGTGLLVESNMGRPTKVEGNPAHPASLGATDIYAQASILQLWDPDRSQTVRRRGTISTWERFTGELDARMTSLEKTRGDGLRILTGPISSPTLLDQLQQCLERYPMARWHQWHALHRDNELEASLLAFGKPVDAIYRLDKAEVVLALEADMFSDVPGAIPYARQFMNTRRAALQQRKMNRLYAVETSPSLTGAKADHRFSMPLPDIEKWIEQLSTYFKQGATTKIDGPLRSIAEDLASHQGRTLIVPGKSLSPNAHGLVHGLNRSIDAVGNTISYIEPVTGSPINNTHSIKLLAEDMRAGHVHTLLILSGNPAYDSPADIGFTEALKQVPFSVHLSLYDDETSSLTTWHLPCTHYLEQWSDAKAFDGTASIVQPLIAPLYGNRSAHDLLSTVMRRQEISAHERVRQYWRKQSPQKTFEDFWAASLRRGAIDGTASSPLAPSVNMAKVYASAAPITVSTPVLSQQKSEQEKNDGHARWDIYFCRDPSVHDGEFANNPWLQEIPKPDSKLTWDNAAHISPVSAQQLSLRNGDMIELRTTTNRLTVPVWITPGHADNSVSLHLGYGRHLAGQIGNHIGFNAYPLRTSDAQWMLRDVDVIRANGSHVFASAQQHGRMEGRDIVRTATILEYGKDSDFSHKESNPSAPKDSLYPQWNYPHYRWGMAIDLTACIGCNACTVACQAENNIPTVGKDQVLRGREMHWIRIDRYYEGPIESPKIHYQPVPCMHCEKAPCEEVCPVGASIHDSEGLNVQVYNRCVGTRFCSNNCPYKVRRFNFLQYAKQSPEQLKAVYNPEVTVRQRGVMEKCTYCIQRITRARIETEKADRQIHDGEVVTACQAVCPTEAIVFGDLNDPNSRVSGMKRSPLNYTLLGELNVQPRTTYLTQVTNPNEAIESS